MRLSDPHQERAGRGVAAEEEDEQRPAPDEDRAEAAEEEPGAADERGEMGQACTDARRQGSHGEKNEQWRVM
jgi:hypothetical protein